MKIFKNVLLALIIIALTDCKKKLPSTLTIVNVNLIDENDKPVEGFTFQIGGSYPKGLSAIGTFNEFIKTDAQGNINFEKLITVPTKNITIQPISDIFTEKILFKTVNGSYKNADSFFLGIGVVNKLNYKLLKR